MRFSLYVFCCCKSKLAHHTSHSQTKVLPQTFSKTAIAGCCHQKCAKRFIGKFANQKMYPIFEETQPITVGSAGFFSQASESHETSHMPSYQHYTLLQCGRGCATKAKHQRHCETDIGLGSMLLTSKHETL